MSVQNPISSPKSLSAKCYTRSTGARATIALLVFTTVSFFLGSKLISAAYTNLALIEVNKVWLADPESSALNPEPNASNYSLVRAIQCLEQAVRWDPKNAKAYWALVQAYFLMGKRSAAAEALAQMEEPRSEGILIHEGKIGLGLMEKLKYGKRLETWYILVSRAMLHVKEREWEKAVADYRKGLALGVSRIGDDLYLEFHQALATLYQKRVAKDPSNPKWHYLLGKYLWKSGEQDEAQKHLEFVVEHRSSHLIKHDEVGQAYYYLGLWFESKGQVAKAIDRYEQALAMNERIMPAYDRLRWLYQANGRLSDAETLQQRLAELQPEYKLGQEVGGGWVLLGYDLDEEPLEAGAKIEMALYWQPPRSIEITKPSWYRAGERWIEVKEVKNLAPNGGFEWDAGLGKAYPYGWPSGISNAPLECHELVIDERDGEKTKYSLA